MKYFTIFELPRQGPATRRFSPALETVQGIAVLAVLYFVLFHDLSRIPWAWREALLEKSGREPGGFLTSSGFFLFLMCLLYMAEGMKTALRLRGPEEDRTLAQCVLQIYLPYWMVWIPFTLIGVLLFSEVQHSTLFSYTFVSPSFSNLLRTFVALTNNLHEGVWLISSLALCTLFSLLFDQVERAGKSKWLRVILLCLCVAVESLLYLKVLPFQYFGDVFPVAAVCGTVFFFAGFLLSGRDEYPALARSDGRLLAGVTAPLRFIGRYWYTFWILMFYPAYYYYNIAASVYRTFSSPAAVYFVLLLISILLFQMLTWIYRQIASAWRTSRRSLFAVPPLLAVPVLLRQVLEISMDYAQYASWTRMQWPHYVMITFAAILCLIAVLRAVTGSWWSGGVIVTVLLTALGLVNHYTIKYHGTIVTAEDLRNIRTAANVIGSYDLSVDETAGKMLLLCAAALVCCVLGFFLSRGPRSGQLRRERNLNRIPCLAVASAVIFLIYFAEEPMVRREDNVWTWQEQYAQIGFFSGTVESTISILSFSASMPDGYSEQEVERISAAVRQKDSTGSHSSGTDSDSPADLIMILNETWYNLDHYVTTGADADYMEHYDALENALKGYTVVPLAGGGTNVTEYEMLTGNSASLLNLYAPFNRMTFTETVTLPSYLKALGYATVAAHPHEMQNYNRGKIWKQMSFDERHFIDDFNGLEYYGSRTENNRVTDSSVLQNLKRFYENMPEDQPRFLFLATMQNHGDWESNSPEQNLVHAALETGDDELDQKIDEFLSCISLTDEVIPELCAYFEEQYALNGRKVVVCMCGDHSPSFIRSLDEWGAAADETEVDQIRRETPYFIWANYPADLSAFSEAETDTMDLCCFMPTALQLADVPLSPYYAMLCELRKETACFTKVSRPAGSGEADNALMFLDRNGMIRSCSEDSAPSPAVRDYFFMEYYLVAAKAETDLSLFLPPD